MTQRFVLYLTIFVSFFSLACNVSGLIRSDEVSVAPTPSRTPLPTFTPAPVQEQALLVPTQVGGLDDSAPVEQVAPEPTATATLVLEPTLEPTATVDPATPTPESTPTPTPYDGDPLVEIVQSMNVRGGPGTNYPVVASAKPGDSSFIMGKLNDESWLQIDAGGAQAWLYAPLVEVKGDLGKIAVVEAPAPPPPVVEAPPEPAQPPPPQYQFTPDAWHASENAGIVQFKGRIRDTAGNLVNGYSVLANNDAFRVVSHPTGASYWYPDKGDGEWDIVMPNLFDAQGWWKLTVVRYDCDFWAAFDATCQNYTKLSEDVRIKVKTPEESIINAHWLCHWDCNKGLYTESFRR